MVDFHKQVLKFQLGLISKADALENLRQKLVYSMRIGDTFVINVDRTTPNFHSTFRDSHVFPSDEILDWDLWHENDFYMKCVRESENHDLIGNKKMFSIQRSF